METRNSSIYRIGFIKASWHAETVDQALLGFKSEISDHTVDVVDVPGAFELPLAARKMAKTGRYDAIVCAALVVDGGIYRHEFVAATVVEGLMRVGLETDVPILSVSLTPHHYHEAGPQREFFHDHFVKKGKEAASAVLGVLEAHARIEALATDIGMAEGARAA
ncbi:6,7-dimethyl-8-ribityllumazine synthase [Agrobacterium tumefaciens]|uniref:6,7-dimethyl-8-ribityllumazine synthase n=1 Tax=Agrobacterium tumefaciens TaxID=358 RepID=UPI001573A157|nr:6,7-dimethyl-8-ribityllumazine synthase [Agrobacterium tumefaciens]NSZ03183.1 6,7-dimethyl-8-ribityllumazine synthase [Agrobacterium tumefaciens]NSZ39798.1 6,7-dimethyl-8-ribityllumazine synthase [Agrobacterium tumefaciens]NTB26756.1 6,7-dimethyl-8-ribityllumazine synthase [Agrobacterium tumefaciens]NTB31850.1 6,7-dimethyl-8-ribityllumazine synthase [Agrobacterium tumefaciens]NTB34295.1 6,7-dimethyl-8-ribityllumazine synthase [Agrobacterium tumefaciens]